LDTRKPKTKTTMRFELDWSARVSLASCIVTVIFGVTTVWQTSRHEGREIAAYQAAARSVAVTRTAELSMVDQYVVKTQLDLSSALHKESFADAVAAGSFAKALSVDASPHIEISLEEMHVIGRAYPDLEASIARCKSAVASMNRSKLDAQSLIDDGPTSDDPENSTAQVYLNFEIQALPAIGKICNEASDGLQAIANPGRKRDLLTSEVFAPVLVRMKDEQKYRLLDRPNGRYQFGPVLENVANGKNPDGSSR